MAFPTISAPVKSPSLAEFDLPTYVDPSSGKVVALLGAALPDANGATGLAAGALAIVDPSQVTARRQKPQAGTAKIPMVALVGVNPSTGAPIPFVAGSAASVSGKFQSAVQTGTGSAQNVAHGLGVIPSLVLVSIYDTNGVAAPYVIAEGTHTTSNIVVTVTASVKFKVIAFV